MPLDDECEMPNDPSECEMPGEFRTGPDGGAEATAEFRLALLERRVRQLWALCRRFKVQIDTCEEGCCSTDAEIGVPEWDRADTDQFERGCARDSDRCIYCWVERREHPEGPCCG